MSVVSLSVQNGASSAPELITMLQSTGDVRLTATSSLVVKEYSRESHLVTIPATNVPPPKGTLLTNFIALEEGRKGLVGFLNYLVERKKSALIRVESGEDCGSSGDGSISGGGGNNKNSFIAIPPQIIVDNGSPPKISVLHSSSLSIKAGREKKNATSSRPPNTSSISSSSSSSSSMSSSKGKRGGLSGLSGLLASNHKASNLFKIQ